jgi:hypothetical protein
MLAMPIISKHKTVQIHQKNIFGFFAVLTGRVFIDILMLTSKGQAI